MTEFHGSVKIRFGDVDNAGIVYFPQILHYVHTVFEDFFGEAVGLPYDEVINRRRIGFPTVHVQADFVKRMNYGDVLDVALSIPRVGRSSADFRYRMCSKRNGSLLAEITVTVCAVDMRRFVPVPIPAHLREVFGRFPGPSSPTTRVPKRRKVRR